jgi:hypothetical protein
LCDNRRAVGAPGLGSVEVRALAFEAEVAAYFELAAATFPGYQRFPCTPRPGGSVAAGWRRFVLETPGFEPARLRGAFRDGELARLAEPAPDEREIRLSLAALTQLVFGARPIAWLAEQPGQEVSAELGEVMAVLCPTGIAFYPFSNRC